MSEDFSDINNSGLKYTSVEDFSRWISSRKAGAMSDDRPNKFEADPEIIRESLLFGETEVDSYLRTGGYSVPVDSDSRTMFEIKKYCYNIAKYYLFGRRTQTKESLYEYSKTLSTLEDIAENKHSIAAPKEKSENSFVHGSQFRGHFSEHEKDGGFI